MLYGMQPRFREDYRALFWAFVLFPSVPIVGLLAPTLVAWALPASLYLAYCAGVLTHNHNHCHVFTKRWCNSAYGAWLSVFYGTPIFVWIPTHNQNHHRHVDSAEDATHTWRYSRKNTLWNALTYPLVSTRWQLPLVLNFVQGARRRKPRLFRQILVESMAVPTVHAAVLGLAVTLHGAPLGALAYGLGLGIPALAAPYFMMVTNYVQHVGCKPESADDHSRNFVSPWVNWLVFEAGYHTVHHEHAGTHWSRYPALHAQRASRIDPMLNEHSLVTYFLKTYLTR